MAFLKRIQDQLSLRSSIRKRYKPFFKTVSHEFKIFDIIENEIPADIAEIYQLLCLKKGKRCEKLRRKYETLAEEISNHNQTVLRLQGVLSSFDPSALLNQPEEWDESRMRLYLDATAEALHYFFPLGSPYAAAMQTIADLWANIEEVRKQHGIFLATKSVEAKVHNGGTFIRHDESLLIQQECNQLLESLGSLRKVYYDFSFLSKVPSEIARQNEELSKREASLPLFEDVGGIAMDSQQRRAAVSGERNALIIAGAGSGKTTTICGRVKYLLEEKGVNPSDILLLSYSRKSADDLAERVKAVSPELTVGTFHKIGLDILKDASKGKYVVEEQFDAIIESYFREELPKDTEALREVLIYYGLFLNNGEYTKKYHNEGELFEDLKKEEFVTFKESLLRMSDDPEAKRTIKKEKVKSFEEMALANFYFINGISYEYERPYEVDVSTTDKRQYTPDFYLTDYGIYHEHYGVDENGRAKQYDGMEEAKYIHDMRWKRLCHAKHKTVCLETYSYEFSNNTVFDKLEERLKAAGVEFHPLNAEQIQNALESVYQGRPFLSFINLIKSFLSLYKSRYEDKTQFDKLRDTQFKTKYGALRAAHFLNICQRIYEYYMNRIRSEGKIDFDDMILQSMRVLPSLQNRRYEHIIVDEFQDISYSRMLFLKSLVEHGNSDLFVVGDDWQSIYRFSGCDLNIFLHFEDYFGFAETHNIENVHRNGQELQDIASGFIQANPEQIRKQIHSDKTLVNPIKVVYYDDECVPALQLTLNLIGESFPKGNILLLGRNNKDIEPYLEKSFLSYDKKAKKYVYSPYPELNLRFSTVHGSKGLEEDFVILLSAEDAQSGFPNKMEDDPLLNLVLSAPSSYRYAEERRLWYVALTRTKSYVFIMVPMTSQSIFLKEMEGLYQVVNPEILEGLETRIPCPRCKGGHLVPRKAPDGRSFYGCSNYPFCKYSIDDVLAVEKNRHCPHCGDFMVFRKGRRGAFLSCHNYPRCRHSEDYDPKKK